MAERKIFAGARLRRLRSRLGLSQSQMAAELRLSPSYLNLMERDQRPLTVQVLLRLSDVYGVEPSEFAGEDQVAIVEGLKEVFADPLLAGEIASPSELTDLADAAPNAARGLTRLYSAWREALERLSNLSHSMAGAAAEPADGAPPLLPAGRAAAFFETAGPWFPALEAAAEAIAARLAPRDDPTLALRSYLREGFGVEVRILPDSVMPVEQARFDRHSARLFVSERVPLVERPFVMARQAALIGHREILDSLTAGAGLAEPEAIRLCRLGFARRLAEAILAPAGRLAEAVREGEPDIQRLTERFTLRPSRLMARLAALGGGRRDAAPPAFLLVLDGSGAVLRRQGGAGFPFPRFGPFCARLPVFDGAGAGLPLRADLVLEDGAAFRVIVLAEDGPRTPPLPAPRRVAVIGWRREDAEAAWPGAERAAARPIGVTCRLCERLDCGHRLQLPLTRPAALNDHVTGPAEAEIA